MKTVTAFWKERPGRILFLIAYTAVATFLALLFPYIMKDLIDGIRSGFTLHQFMRSFLLLGGIGLGKALISATLPYMRGRTNEIFNLRERNNIFTRVLAQGHSFANKFPAGDVLERIDADLGELSWFACSGIFRPIEGIMVLSFALFFLTRINWQLALIAVLPMCVTIVAFIKLSPIIYRRFMKWREMISRIHSELQSNFSGIRIIKSYNMEAQTSRAFHQTLIERVEVAKKALRVEIMMHSLFASFEEIGIVFVLIFGGIFILKGHLTIGEFIAFNAYILMLLRPMIDIGNFFVVKKRADVQISRIEEVKSFEPDVPDRGKAERFDSYDLACRNVSFQYGRDMPYVLDQVNLKLADGSKIGIVGTVGSGKSTLLKLLMRIAEPSRGEVKMGSMNIKDFPLSTYRSLMAYVPQEPSLYSDTLLNNLTFGRKIEPGKIGEAVRLAQLDEFIRTCANGLDEKIGERGLKLSGGEKQRVAIARAILAEPRFLFLDDATSNLDAETERNFLDQLSKKQDLTVVIISHRLSILSACDYIYVLDKGRVVEEGLHSRLIRKRGLYWKLYQRQLMEETLEKMEVLA